MRTLKRFISKLLPRKLKNLGYHLPLAVVANVAFGFPGRDLTIIGVTGTNGKTTTTKLIAAMLSGSGKKTAFTSTIEYGIGEDHWVNTSKFTTSSAWELQRFLAQAKKAGCTHVVLETSSHSLDQYRTWGIVYTMAVITNVTREHLDYHETMEHYRRTKRKLFNGVEKAIVNADMEQPEEYFIPAPGETITYSTKDQAATIFASEIELDFTGTRFLALGTSFHIELPGLFNVENALAAIATGHALGLAPTMMRDALGTVRGVKGRMELVPNERNIDILIDYAVTPDSFEKLYATVLPLRIPGTKVIHVFGACGERDRGKRPEMGRIASDNADIIILTNEDPYHEDPERIISEIEAGLPDALRKQSASMRAGVTKKKPARPAGGNETYFRIFDRRQAIRQALALAEAGDIVLVTGKGAEETMAMGDERLPWREHGVILEELAALENGAKEKATT